MNVFKLLIIVVSVVSNNVLFAQSIIDYVKVEDYSYVEKYTGSVNIYDENHATPLMWASYYGDLEMVKLLISKGASPQNKGLINEAESNLVYGSAMVVAAGKGKVDIVAYYVEKCKIPVDDMELNANLVDENGWNALQWATVNNQCEVVKYLVKKKAKINARSPTDNGKTALMLAVMYGNLEAFTELIDLGAKLNIKDNYERNVMYYALSSSENDKYVKILLENKMKCDAKCEERILKVFKLENLNEL